MSRLSLAFASLLSLASPLPTAAAPILFEVRTYCESFADPNCAPDFDLPYPVAGGGSETYGSHGSVRAFASFQLAQDSFIESVTVIGVRVAGPVQFWNETRTVLLAEFAPIAINSAFHGRGPVLGSGFRYFSYEMVLGAPFLAAAGSRYFVSAPGLWEIGFAGGPSEAYQCAIGDEACPQQFPVRRVAFSLQGQSVPEPGSLFLLISGVAALGALRGRRNR